MKKINKLFFLEETAGGLTVNVYISIYYIKIIRLFGRKFKYIKHNGYDVAVYEVTKRKEAVERLKNERLSYINTKKLL